MSVNLKYSIIVITLVSCGSIFAASMFPKEHKNESNNPVPSMGNNPQTGKPFYGKIGAPAALQIELLEKSDDGKKIKLKAYIKLQSLQNQSAEVIWNLPEGVRNIGNQTEKIKINPSELTEIIGEFELSNPEINYTISLKTEFSDHGNKKVAVGYYLTNKEKSPEASLNPAESEDSSKVFEQKNSKKKKINIRY